MRVFVAGASGAIGWPLVQRLVARRPLRVPRWIARLGAGSAAVAIATTLRGASNRRAKAELAWEPESPSWRQGFRQALG